jgi:hypothetical protein
LSRSDPRRNTQRSPPCGYYTCADFDLSTTSLNPIAGLADIVVPGHGNFFLDVTDHG